MEHIISTIGTVGIVIVITWGSLWLASRKHSVLTTLDDLNKLQKGAKEAQRKAKQF